MQPSRQSDVGVYVSGFRGGEESMEVPLSAESVSAIGAGPRSLAMDFASRAPAPARAARHSPGDSVARRFAHALVLFPASTWMLFDITVVCFGVFLGFLVFPPPHLDHTPHVALWQAPGVFAFALILASLVFGLYERETVMSRSRIATRLLLTAAATAVIAYAVIYILMYATVSRRVAGLTLAVLLVGGGSPRFLACWAAHAAARGLLVVGSRHLFDSFRKAQELGALPEYRLAGYVGIGANSPNQADPNCCGRIVEQIPFLRERSITDVVVSDDAARHPEVMTWMVPCLQQGCRVTNEAIFYETATGQILVDQITPAWFLFADLKTHCDQRATIKRAVDVWMSALALVISIPLGVVIALAIKIGDRGKVLYSQKRVGQNGRVFTLYKFRTMRDDAENGRSVWAAPNDPRVTRVGRWLRRSRLDELPQLFNVLVGDMSIVGPRPERPDLVADLAERIPFYNERHLVKPGITGWAQISFRYGSSLEDSKRKLQFDLYYLKHMSFELDTIILFRTLGTFLRGAC